MDEREISLTDFWNAIRANMLSIMTLALIVGLATWAVNNFFIQPEYQAQLTLIVGKPENYQDSEGITYSELQVNQRLVGTYSEIIKSDTVMSQVNERLKLSASVRSLSNKIRVSTVNNTEIISLYVTDTIPERAMDIANETASIFMDEVVSIMKVDNVQILDAARLPEYPISPRILMNTSLGIAVGAVIGIVLSVFKEITNTKVRNPEDYKKNFSIPIIGIIPDVK